MENEKFSITDVILQKLIILYIRDAQYISFIGVIRQHLMFLVSYFIYLFFIDIEYITQILETLGWEMF